MARYQKLLRLPEQPTLPVREMQEKDLAVVHPMLLEHLAQFDTHFHFSLQELRHFMLPRNGVIEAYVILDEAG
jgi:glycylpeptide N-tetradecanoyltransferase